jgi:hypothetical protein
VVRGSYDQRRRCTAHHVSRCTTRPAPERPGQADLEAFEEVGLVERREPGVESEEPIWAGIGRGIFFEIPEDAEGQSAARQLSNTMLLQYADLPLRWVSDDEPRLTVAWARAAGMFNAKLLLTADELRDIQAALEGLLEPYLTRRPDDAPPDASRVRILSYFMPGVPGT